VRPLKETSHRRGDTRSSSPRHRGLWPQPTKLNETGNIYLCTAVHTCPAQLQGRIESFAERDRMDIVGLGEEMCKALVSSGLVPAAVADLYT
jgi:NAD-dependent DNA ligase